MSINITQVCTGRGVGQAELLPFFGQYQYVAIHYGKTPSHTDTHTGRRRERERETRRELHMTAATCESRSKILSYTNMCGVSEHLRRTEGGAGGRDAGEGT